MKINENVQRHEVVRDIVNNDKSSWLVDAKT